MTDSTALAAVAFREGLKLLSANPVSRINGPPGICEHWEMIGTLDAGTPFLLSYSGFGLTSWCSPAPLPANLRRKILHALRTTCRYAAVPPAFVAVHDLTALSAQDAAARALDLLTQFHQINWRRDTLHETQEDFILLRVPFAEKDQAKAAGATWNATAQQWQVRRSADMTAFTRWLPNQ